MMDMDATELATMQGARLAESSAAPAGRPRSGPTRRMATQPATLARPSRAQETER